MPYRKRPSRYRRPKSTAWYDKKYSARDAAGHVATVARRVVKQYVNSEKKWFNTAGSLVEVDNVAGTPIVQVLNNIIQGTDDNERIGRQIKVTSTAVRGTLEWNTAATTPTIARVMLIAWRRSGGGVPSISNLMQGTVPWSFVDTEHTREYTLLASRIYNLSVQTPQVAINLRSNKDFKCQYNGTAAADYDNNGVFMLAWSDDGTAPPKLSYQARIRYLDN